jgi:hypothetical protein
MNAATWFIRASAAERLDEVGELLVLGELVLDGARRRLLLLSI